MIVDEDVSDFDNDTDFTVWGILFNSEGRWMICSVPDGSEIGEFPLDNPDGEDFRLSGFFDQEVVKILNAISVLGGSDAHPVIEELLAGTCRAFLEAVRRQDKWQGK
jgi:hypothetical protein